MTDPLGLTARAEHLLEVRRYDEARSVLTRLIASDPDDAHAWCLLAGAYLGLDDAPRMLDAANRAVSLAPDEEWGHRLASIALDDIGNHAGAVTAAREARRLAPHDHQTHVQFALVAVHYPNLRWSAFEAAQQAVELGPHSADAHFAVGYTAGYLELVEAARDAYAEALRLDPHHASAHNNLTALSPRSLRLGKLAEGYTSALRSDPSMSIARDNLETLGYRFVRRLYWASLVTFLVCLVAGSAEGSTGPSPWRLAAGMAVLVGFGAYTLLLHRHLPSGVTAFLRMRLRQSRFLLATAGLSVAMLLAALAAAFLPTEVFASGALLRPLGLANLGLVIWSFARRSSDEY